MTAISKPRICIIGGGWYGCHIANVLASKSYSVTVYETNSRLMQGASGYNTFRLHRGPHYPRDEATRRQVNESFHRFCLTYPTFVIDQHKAWYAIGNVDSDGKASLVGGDEFKMICEECDPDFKLEEPSKIGIENVEVLCSVDEKTISVDRPELYFIDRLRKLGVDLKLSCHVIKLENELEKIHVSFEDDKKDVHEEIFDVVINCTYFRDFSSESVPKEKIFYEPCVSFYYKPKNIFLRENLISLSIFDGMFPSIDPYVTNRHKNYADVIKNGAYRRVSIDDVVLYLLTHAKFTALGKFDSYEEADRYLGQVTKEELNERRESMEKHFSCFYPNFHNDFEFSGEFLSVKTKLESETCFRGTLVLESTEHAHVLHVLSGKVSTIFEASDTIEKYLTERFPVHQNAAV